MGGALTHRIGVNAAGGAPSPELAVSAFTAGVDSATDGTTYSYTASGLPAGDKVVLIFVWSRSSILVQRHITALTAESGALAATAISTAAASTTTQPMGAYFVTDVTGTSTDIEVTFSGTMTGCYMGHVVLTDARQDTYYSRHAATLNALSGTAITTTPGITIPAGGIGFAMLISDTDAYDTVWTADAGSPSEILDASVPNIGGTPGTRCSLCTSANTSATAFTATTSGSTVKGALAFSWAVAPDPLGISGTPVTAIESGETYSATFNGYDGYGIYVYSVGAGTLPPGLALNSATGALSGIPNAAGTYASIAIRVTDATGGTADSPAFTITVSSSGSGNSFDSSLITFDSTTHTMDEN